jgi:hypothetical protein
LTGPGIECRTGLQIPGLLARAVGRDLVGPLETAWRQCFMVKIWKLQEGLKLIPLVKSDKSQLTDFSQIKAADILLNLLG